MPKQIIWSDQPAFYMAPNGGEHRVDLEDIPLPEGTDNSKVYRRGVKVGWSRNRYVEIGVAQIMVSTEMTEAGIFLSLDRDGINELIRSLQRARNAAFGKDA